MGVWLISDILILIGCAVGSILLLVLLAMGLAILARGKCRFLPESVQKLYFPQMENKGAEAENRDRGHDRIDHLPQ